VPRGDDASARHSSPSRVLEAGVAKTRRLRYPVVGLNVTFELVAFPTSGTVISQVSI
jgi:hypothetical protein